MVTGETVSSAIVSQDVIQSHCLNASTPRRTLTLIRALALEWPESLSAASEGILLHCPTGNPNRCARICARMTVVLFVTAMKSRNAAMAFDAKSLRLRLLTDSPSGDLVRGDQRIF